MNKRIISFFWVFFLGRVLLTGGVLFAGSALPLESALGSGSIFTN